MSNEEKKTELKLEKPFCAVAFLKLLWLPLAVLVGVYAAYLGYVPLKTGIHTLILITIIFIIYIFFISNNAIYLICRFKKNSAHVNQSVEHFLHVNAFEVNGTNKAIGNIEPIFKEYYSILRNENYSSVASTIFPTLGILGTFISIAISMPDFGASTSEALEAEISLLLSGVGTAFYVSIYGIFLSLWWIFFEKRGLTLFEISVNQIIEKNRNNIWTQYELDHAKYVESHRLQKEMLATLSLFRADEYVAGMDKTIRERFDVFEDFVKAESKVVTQIDEKLTKTVEAMRSSQETDENMIENYSTIAQSVRDVTSQLHTNNSSLQELLNFSSKREISLNDTVVEMSQTLQSSLDTIKDQNEQFVQQKREMLKTFSHMIQGNSDFTNLFTTQYNELLEAIQDSKSSIATKA